jgi:hypothetical protein
VKRNHMCRFPLSHVRRYAVAALCSLFAVVLPTAAGAETLRADLDGDGIHDRIELIRRSGLLTVSLSGTRRSLHFAANDPIVRFVVGDIDRDGDSDVVAETRHSGLRFWINQGRGRFAAQSQHLRPRAIRAHHPRPIARGVEAPRDDDRALNDANRLLAVLSPPLRDALIAAGPMTTLASAAPPDVTHRGTAARGPPRLRLS